MILVIEDDAAIAELIALHLRAHQLEPHVCGESASALTWLETHTPALIVLDVMLPDIGGFDVCRRLRKTPALRSVPILMLTARTAEQDRIAGFEVGADDYVGKPFSPRELMLRVQALLRRSQPPGATAQLPKNYTYGPIRLMGATHTVAVDHRAIAVTVLEFRLLQFFLAQPEIVATREQLLQRVWEYDAAVTTRTVDTHIKRLREKLGAAGELIETIRGVGYRLRTVEP